MNEPQKLPFDTNYTAPPPGDTPTFPTGKREQRLWWVLLILSVLGADFALFGGFGLGFALIAIGLIVVPWIYLKRSGRRSTPYAAALLILSGVLAGSFFRSDDAFVKFVSVCFLLISVPLALNLTAGKNRRDPKGLLSLLDAPRALLVLGVGRLPEAMKGFVKAEKTAGKESKNRSAALVGLAVAVPLVAVLLSLLSSADAAFEGLLKLVPEVDFGEPVAALVCGFLPVPVLYTMCVALHHDRTDSAAPKEAKGLHPVTVNTVLMAVCAVYLVYLSSQLAYFVGGLSGLLPEEYTLAQYARRGFFEMAILCLLNLGVMAAAVGLVSKTGHRAPLLTRSLSLFVGIVSLFFVVSASAKMFLYIDSYGLTRLRVLTEVIMVFLALTTIFVSIWLFVPKFAYMKAVLLTALAMCSITAWVDVDTVVAKYNVWAYQSGKVEFVDVYHLGELSKGAIPALEALAADENEGIASSAEYCLRNDAAKIDELDIRALTLSDLLSRPILEKYKTPEKSVDTPQPKPDHQAAFQEFQSYFQFAAEEILSRTHGNGQWRQLVYVIYPSGPVLEDIRTGDQFPCDRALAATMELLIDSSFPPQHPLDTIVVWNDQVHFCDSNGTYALVYSPKKPPTWLSNPGAPEDFVAEGLGSGWYHVTQ